MNLTAEVVGCILERITDNMEANNDSPMVRNRHSSFDSVAIPAITVREYFARLYLHTDCSDSCYILCFIYLDRLLQSYPELKLSKRNIHRLILSTLILAIKYTEDRYYDNEVYAKIGGVSLKELNNLEVRMLFLLDYGLYVSNELFMEYVQALNNNYQNIMIEQRKIRYQKQLMVDVCVQEELGQSFERMEGQTSN